LSLTGISYIDEIIIDKGGKSMKIHAPMSWTNVPKVDYNTDVIEMRKKYYEFRQQIEKTEKKENELQVAKEIRK